MLAGPIGARRTGEVDGARHVRPAGGEHRRGCASHPSARCTSPRGWSSGRSRWPPATTRSFLCRPGSNALEMTPISRRSTAPSDTCHNVAVGFDIDQASTKLDLATLETRDRRRRMGVAPQHDHRFFSVAMQVLRVRLDGRITKYMGETEEGRPYACSFLAENQFRPLQQRFGAGHASDEVTGRHEAIRSSSPNGRTESWAGTTSRRKPASATGLAGRRRTTTRRTPSSTRCGRATSGSQGRHVGAVNPNVAEVRAIRDKLAAPVRLRRQGDLPAHPAAAGRVRSRVHELLTAAGGAPAGRGGATVGRRCAAG